jgi:hypothetical protein
MHPAFMPPPVGTVNRTFTLSFAEWADGGPETVLHMLVDFQFLIWHRWNGNVVNTMVRITSCEDGFVYGVRQVDRWDDQRGYDAGPWQCAVADLIHVEYQ